VPLFTSGVLRLRLVSSGLGLVILVLVLRICSCLRHCCPHRTLKWIQQKSDEAFMMLENFTDSTPSRH